MTTELILGILGSSVIVKLLDILMQYLSNRKKNTTEHDDKLNLIIEALIGIYHDRLYVIIQNCLEEGHKSVDELDNCTKLYNIYRRLGGNGTIEEMFKDFKQLPTKKS